MRILKNLISIFKKYFFQNDRDKNIFKHVGLSFIYKFFSVIINFSLVPLTIDYLDSENYGIWLTLSSFVGWFSFLDIGLGNGLRNKFTESKSTGKYKKAQSFVSTAYFSISIISIVILIIFFLLNFFADWGSLLNTNQDAVKDLNILVPALFTFFSIQLVAKLVSSLYLADQDHSIQSKIELITQIFSIFLILLLLNYGKSSLLLFGLIFSSLPALILVFLNIYAFNNSFKKYRPKLSLFNFKYLSEITSLGFKFFVIQLSGVVLFSTDNVIISNLFGPSDVVPYNIAFKYFSIITMVFTMITTPYWSSFSEAFAKNDISWIKKSVSKIQKLWFFIPIFIIFLVLMSDIFYRFWIGDKVYVPLSLSISMAIYVCIISFNMIYSNFIYGVGKIKLNLIFSLISMIINIPLSIFFSKNLDLGPKGVILATCFCLLYALPFLPIQYFKIINGKANGIWNK